MNQSSKYDFLRDKLDTQNSEKSSTQNSENLTSQQPEKSSTQNSENLTSQQPENLTSQQPENLTSQQPENLSIQNSENLTSQQPENLSIQNSENTKSEEIEVKESKTLVGRPKGKRSNADYIQVTCYIKKGTHKSVKRDLFEIDKEFSELIEELLQKWLASN